jgi:single-strand DNA-binding protein
LARDNHVTITGNLTRDPEMRFTQSGSCVVNFGIATNQRWQDQSGEWQESVSFFDVVVWNDLAEHVGESVVKGSRVTVVGRLDQRSWETDEGENRYKVEITAEDVSISLMWATCEITKITREQPKSKPTKAAAKKAPPQRRSNNRQYENEEEPF